MDSFFGIGPMELFVIAVLALIVLGPERLPGAIREVAKQLRALRSISNEFTSQFSEELQALDELNPNKILRDLTTDPADQKKPTSAPAKGAAAAKPAAAKPDTPKRTPPPAKTESKSPAETNPADPPETNPADPPETAAVDSAEGELLTDVTNSILPPAKQPAEAVPSSDVSAEPAVPPTSALKVERDGSSDARDKMSAPAGDSPSPSVNGKHGGPGETA